VERLDTRRAGAKLAGLSLPLIKAGEAERSFEAGQLHELVNGVRDFIPEFLRPFRDWIEPQL